MTKANMPIERQYLTTVEAAELMHLSPRTLEKYRFRGTGPAYSKLGKVVRYSRATLEAWFVESTRRSTKPSKKELPCPTSS
ncbi:helix-turn-helix domain-containing protein [Asticcacaulis endophyticus]|uniref:Helix-turn-helix domain-containing protein n=1 Tax=Asticcacaulis endophyticus TaxID=1395890 RepID=A0A918QAR2_9CAUL|nr:helix-turn-helix domain-containing protein [Asticcacaulis endophyticus]GGZ39312.1 hypothetical protein GCM10011273_27190 [Asticcacaulis endophyticus]